MSEEELDAAIAKAARILAAARFPVIAGLGTDVAGAVAAIRLAEKVGAAIDHDAAGSALRLLSVMRDTGLMLVTPGEALARADVLLIVGDQPYAATELPLRKASATEQKSARLLALGSSDAVPTISGRSVESLSAPGLSIPSALAALRACLNKKPIAAGFRSEAFDRFAGTLRAAKYGVVVFAPEELDTLSIEMLTGLIKDLNEATRWSGLPIVESGSAAGAMMVAGWTTGLPLRSAFIGGSWQHDPWRFEAKRMLAEGEADAALYICSYGDPPPDWLPDIPAVLLLNAREIQERQNAAHIAIGEPGRDHDAVLYDRQTGALVHRAASAPSSAPSVAQVLKRLAERLERS